MRYALANFPVIQALRFLTKVGLAALVGSGEYGEAALAGLLAFLLGHAACFGLDEVLVSARSLDQGLLRRLQATHLRSGALAGLALSLAYFLPPVRDYQRLPLLVAALGPMVVLANQAVLPTALLVRSRDYRAVFRSEAGGIVALSLTTLAAGALGAGAWSLILGWYANAAAATLLSRRYAAPWRAALPAAALAPGADGAPAADGAPGADGLRFMSAGLLAFVGERADTLAIGLFLGRQLVGLYDLAQHLTHVTAQFMANLTERLFFPLLAERERAGDRLQTFARLHHHSVLWVGPLHISLALLAPALAARLPEAWASMGPILAALALASGARCLDLLCLSAIKAGAHSRQLLALQSAQLALLALALGFGLGRGPAAVASAVALARGVSWLASLGTLAWTQRGARLRLRAWLGAPALLLTWCAPALLVHAGLCDWGALVPRSLLEAALLAGLWWFLRRAFDGEALGEETLRLRALLALGGVPR